MPQGKFNSSETRSIQGKFFGNEEYTRQIQFFRNEINRSIGGCKANSSERRRIGPKRKEFRDNDSTNRDNGFPSSDSTNRDNGFPSSASDKSY
jgi:hypothetical protein